MRYVDVDTYFFQAATAAAATLVRPTPWRRGLVRMVSSTLWSTCAGFRSSLPLCSGRRPDRSTTFRCVDKKRKKIDIYQHTIYIYDFHYRETIVMTLFAPSAAPSVSSAR